MKHNLNKIARNIRRKLKSLDIKDIERTINTYGYAVAYIGTARGDEELLQHDLSAYADGKNSFLYARTVKIVFVRYDLHNQDKKYALLHELAHIVLGHIGNGSSAWIDSSYAEMEAQALSYLIIEQEHYFTFMKWATAILITLGIILTTSIGTRLTNQTNIKNAVQTATPVATPQQTAIPVSAPQETTAPKTTTEDGVFVTSTGECYHMPDCRYVRNNSAIPISRTDATTLYRPCKVCKP